MGGLKARHTTNLNLLPDGRVGLVQHLFDGLAAHIAGEELISA